MAEKVCFILSSIGEEGSPERIAADEKYDFVFEPVLRESGYIVKRADKEGTPNSISRDIVSRIINSELVIADVSDSNPNVFYELAIRNAVKKPVIVIKHPKQRLPFDIYDKRAVQLDMKDNRQWNKAKVDLADHIKSADGDPRSASESILSDFTFDIDKGKAKDTEFDVSIQLKDIKDSISVLRSDTIALRGQFEPNRSLPLKESLLPTLSVTSQKQTYKVGEDVVVIVVAHQTIDRDYHVHLQVVDDSGVSRYNQPTVINKGFREALWTLIKVKDDWKKGKYDMIVWSYDMSAGVGAGFSVI